MADLTLEAFEAQATSACAASPIVVAVSIVASGITWTHLRAHFADDSFADAFYNEVTGKTAFALIRDSRRIFGADNKGGWHWHVFEDPDGHLPEKLPIAFAEFLLRIEERWTD